MYINEASLVLTSPNHHLLRATPCEYGWLVAVNQSPDAGRAWGDQDVGTRSDRLHEAADLFLQWYRGSGTSTRGTQRIAYRCEARPCMKTPARQQDHPPKSSEAASHMGNILKCSHNAPLLTQWPHISMSGSIWEVKILGDNIAIVACQPSEAPRISEAWVKVETSQNNLEEWFEKDPSSCFHMESCWLRRPHTFTHTALAMGQARR